MTSETFVAGLQRGDIFELLEGRHAGLKGAVIRTEMLGMSLMDLTYLYKESVNHVVISRSIRATTTKDPQ